MSACLHLVDDDARFRTALARLLRALGHTVQEYESAAAFLQAAPTGPGCVLLDVDMPGVSGVELQAELARRGIALPVIFITGHGDIPMSVRAVKAGAEDFLTKPVSREALGAAIDRALVRDAQQRQADTALQARQALLARLSPREQQVAALLAQGWLNKQVAFSLGTTERTIKAHRAQIMAKLGIRSLPELVRLVEALPPRP